MIDLSDTEISKEKQRLIALVTGVLAFIAGCLFYDKLTFTNMMFDPFWFLHDEDRLVFKIPGLIHGIIGIIILTPLYIRKIIAYRNLSVISLLLLSNNIYLFAAWAQLATGFQDDFNNAVINMSLIAAILLGWLGMKSIAGFCWIIVVALGAYNMADSSEMLAAWGVSFLVLSIISMWFQTRMPLDSFFSSMKSDFISATDSEFAHAVKDNITTFTSSASGYARSTSPNSER